MIQLIPFGLEMEKNKYTKKAYKITNYTKIAFEIMSIFCLNTIFQCNLYE